MKVYRAHVYFEACASFDVEAGTREYAEAVARAWFAQLTDQVIDTGVVVEGKRIHVEDAMGGINEIDVEKEPYEREDPWPST